MVVLVEVFRPEIDPFFGFISGWHVLSPTLQRYNPFDDFPCSTGTIVFEKDNYHAAFTLDLSCLTSSRWAMCNDQSTRLHVQSSPYAPPSPTFSEYVSHPKIPLVLDALNSKPVLVVSFPTVHFQVLTWPQESAVNNHTFRLDISFGKQTRALNWSGEKSDLVSNESNFSTPVSNESIGVTLAKINPKWSRVVSVDETKLGYMQGIRVGDILVSTENATRYWKRLQTRSIEFQETVEFDDEDDDASASFHVALYVVQASIANDFPALEPLEPVFLSNEQVLIQDGTKGILGMCELVRSDANVLSGVSFKYMSIFNAKVECARHLVESKDICTREVSVSFSNRIHICLMDPHDFALISFSHVKVGLRHFEDSSQTISCRYDTFQLDDLSADAQFPVCISTKPFALEVELGPTGPDPSLIHLDEFHLSQGPITFKVSSLFTSRLSGFSLLSEDIQQVQPTPPPPPRPKRLVIGKVCIDPMKWNITFKKFHDSHADVLSSRFPLYSSLISLFASLSNAPLHLAGLQLKNEFKTMDTFSVGIKQHYVNQVKKQLFQLAGSLDMMGNPVQLLGDVSQGIFSFLSEPALAMGSGGDLAQGLTRGSAAIVDSAAGSVLESLAQICRSVANALANTTGDDLFAQWLLLNLEDEREPLNVLEGVSQGTRIFAKSVYIALVSFLHNPSKLLNLLLKPSSGFFASLNQVSLGLRNFLVEERDAVVLPMRLAKPREMRIQPYSASRCAGYLLARLRFGEGVHLVLNRICRTRVTIGEVTRLSIVHMIMTVNWLVASKEIGTDVWALPLDCIQDVSVVGNSVKLRCLGNEYEFDSLEALTWKQALSLAVSALTNTKNSQTEEEEEEAQLNLLQIVSYTLHNLLGRQGDEVDIFGMSLDEAKIQSSGEFEDGVTYYRIQLTSYSEGKPHVSWTVERRYREFREFRNRCAHFLGVSRKFIPLPGRRPWTLSVAEREDRKKGLQTLLDTVRRLELLAESEVLREFLTHGADNVWVYGENE